MLLATANEHVHPNSINTPCRRLQSMLMLLLRLPWLTATVMSLTGCCCCCCSSSGRQLLTTLNYAIYMCVETTYAVWGAARASCWVEESFPLLLPAWAIVGEPCSPRRIESRSAIKNGDIRLESDVFLVGCFVFVGVIGRITHLCNCFLRRQLVSYAVFFTSSRLLWQKVHMGRGFGCC